MLRIQWRKERGALLYLVEYSYLPEMVPSRDPYIPLFLAAPLSFGIAPKFCRKPKLAN